MKARLPKNLREFKFDRLFEVELNNFDIERILPDLFFLVVSKGRQRGRTPNDARAVGRYMTELTQHPAIAGIDEDASRRLLDRWVRATVISTARATKRLTIEQIDYLLPLSLAIYKPGFPAITSRQRNIPGFLYGAMLEAVDGGDQTVAEDRLLDLFRTAFGRGVTIGPAPDYAPTFDGNESLDIHTRLSLAYLDGFDPVMASSRARTRETGAALPAQAEGIGRRLLSYLEAYGDRLPATVLARGFLSIASLELLAYSLKLFHDTVSLVRENELPLAMRGIAPSPPEIYCDFTGMRGGPSDELARACVDRDLEALTHFYDAVIRLKTLERYVRRRPDWADQLDGLGADTPAYLVRLRSMEAEPRITVYAETELDLIRDQTAEALGDEESNAVAAHFEAQRRAAPDELTATVGVIADAQRSVYLTNLTKWFSNAGGLREGFGMLVGNATGRRNWRYVMSDELLLATVKLAFVDPQFQGRRSGDRLQLRELIAYLEDAYGILIDRPPVFLESSSARAAARDNLTAFKRKLRQMGYFDELSDDFSAQYLTMRGASQ